MGQVLPWLQAGYRQDVGLPWQEISVGRQDGEVTEACVAVSLHTQHKKWDVL